MKRTKKNINFYDSLQPPIDKLDALILMFCQINDEQPLMHQGFARILDDISGELQTLQDSLKFS